MIYSFGNAAHGVGYSRPHWPVWTLIAAAITLLAPGLPAAAQSYGFVAKWGTAGAGNGQFNVPYGVASDASNNIYVADSANNSVQKFNSTGTFLLRFGNTGSVPLRLNAPGAVAVSSALNVVFVADTNANRIQRYNAATGAAIARWGALGTGNSQFNAPSGIALDISNNVYVADTGNNRIQKFTSLGGYTTQWGSAGTGNGQFNAPTGIAVDSANNVYVMDRNNNRVQKFSSTGAYIAQWGASGSGDGQFSSARHLAVDSAGNVFVADTGNNRMQKFTSLGVYTTQWGTLGAADGQFSAPRGVTVDSTGRVYVADTTNNRIQKFGLLPVAPSNPGETGTTTTAITFTWQDNSLDETGFKVYADLGAGPPLTLRTTTAANVTSWSWTGLTVNTQYAFQVAATSAIGDTTKSTNYPAWTLAATPLAPIVSNPTASTMDIAVAPGDGNPAITTYALLNTDSGLYVQAGGTLGAAPVFQTAAAWGTVTVSGLADQTAYSFAAIARNGASVDTSASPAGSASTLDGTPPNAISIVPAGTGPTNATSMDFTVNFDEDVQNFGDAADLVLSHSGTAHSGVTITGGPLSYTVSVTGVSGDGSFTLAVSTASDVQDLAGNPLASSPVSAAVTFDFTQPNAISIVPAGTSPTNATSMDFTVDFDEDVQNFGDAADLVLSHSGTAHSGVTITGGPLSYTVSVTGVSGDGSFTLAVSTASDVQDLAGNPLASSPVSTAVTFDFTQPVISIGAPTPDTTAVGPVTFSVTYAGADSTTLDAADITLITTGTAMGAVAVAGSGNTYTVTVAGLLGDGTIAISIAAGTATDLAGNLAPAAGPSAFFTVDSSVPALSLYAGLPVAALVGLVGVLALRRRR